MNILFVTQVWPKQGQTNMYSDFVATLCNDGQKVCVLALNEKRNGGGTGLAQERGAAVLRVKCGNIQKTNKYEKVISSLLAGPALERALKAHSPFEHYDLIIWALSTTLITSSILRIKKRYGAKLYLLLKEYWPQDPVDLGAMKEGGMIYRYFKHVERRMVAYSDYIGACSPAGIRYIEERYPAADRMEVCPHCTTPTVVHKENRREIRVMFELPQDKCIFLYGGNFGVSQGIDDMISCISAAQAIPEACFVLLGSGTEFDKVKEAFQEKGHVYILDNLSAHAFFELASACDVGMLFLFSGYRVPNIPGKFNTYLNAELPILAAVDHTTDVGDLVEQNGCGKKVFNGDTSAFCQAVRSFLDPQIRESMSQNAKKLLVDQYTPECCWEIIKKHF